MSGDVDPSRADDGAAGLPARVAVVVSRYNRTVTDALQAGALAEWVTRGGDPGSVELIDAPGAFELPVLAAAAVRSGRFGAVVALGCVIRGETDHDRYISAAVADQLARLSVDSLVPVGFGLITANTPEQALARSVNGDEPGGKGNKGRETMAAVLDAGRSIEALRSGVPAGFVSSAPDKLQTHAAPGGSH